MWKDSTTLNAAMEFDPPDSLPRPASPPAIVRPEILTVSQLNQAVSRLLERSFPLAWISGEISNFTRAASGHWYFTLKDTGAQVRAVMFRGRAQHVDFAPREGDKIEVRATVSLYAPRGDFQLNVETMRRAGVGNLYEAFLRLKAQLAAEGLFDPARKRELPAFPRTVGIVTSPQAAALHDMITAFRRRAPHVQLVLYPTLVQGEAAAAQIAQAIATASARAECDVLIVGRGGGSLEDLWCFNDERVARAIAACPVPVISGVGHETDFTIADFVADLREPTPTAAGELAATSRADWLAELGQHADGIDAAMRRQLNESTQTLDWLARRVQGPEAAISRHRLKLDALAARLQRATDTPLSNVRFRLAQSARRLQHALPDTRLMRTQLDARSEKLAAGFQACRVAAGHRLSAIGAQLDLLAPQRTLERGYAIVQDEQGRVLRDTAQLKAPQTLHLKLASGSSKISINKVTPESD